MLQSILNDSQVLDALARATACPRVVVASPLVATVAKDEETAAEFAEQAELLSRTTGGPSNRGSYGDGATLTLTPAQRAEVEALFRPDFEAWRKKCATGQGQKDLAGG